MARNIIAASVCLLFATASACASPLSLAPVSGAPSGSLIPAVVTDGFAPSGPNLSLVPGVMLYSKALSASTTQMSAYDSQGNLLWVSITSGGVVKVLPVGLLASKVNVSTDADGPKADAVITCPCHEEVVYDGPNGTIIVIYDANGNIAQVIVLPMRGVAK